MTVICNRNILFNHETKKPHTCLTLLPGESGSNHRPEASGSSDDSPRPALRPFLGFLVAVLLALPTVSFGQIFVDADAIAGANNGTTWTDAFVNLQDALAAATSSDQIWVAEGVYYPDEGGSQADNNRSATFQLINGVEIYGGFAGGESTLGERDVEASPGILSGDIDGNDTAVIITDPATEIQGNNSFHVVTGSGTDDTALLNGFTITAGLANGEATIDKVGGGMFNDGGSPTLTNVTFSGNAATTDSPGDCLSGCRGGGMFNVSSSPTLTNVAFAGNSAVLDGGGMYNSGSSPVLTNVTFTGNSATGGGGGMYNGISHPMLTNVTFAGNSAGGFGGGILNNLGSDPTLTNVIIWGNQAVGSTNTASASIHNTDPGAIPDISYSLIANSGGSGGGWDTAIGADGGNNIDADPRFVDAADPDGADDIFGTTDDGLALQNTSPAINTGDPATNLSLFPGGPGNPIDLAGNPRVFDGVPNTDIIDMGAYEFQDEPFGITLTVDEGWRMLSSPIDGLSYDDMLGDLWTQGMPGADYEGDENTFPNVYNWDFTYPDTCLEGVECPGWIIPSPGLGATIPAGAGFIIFVFEDDDFDEGTVEGFPKTITLSGPTHTGDVSPPINNNAEAWTLVGNPYARPIDFASLEHNASKRCRLCV